MEPRRGSADTPVEREARVRLEGQAGSLGPHAGLLLGEALAAMDSGSYASVIVLAAAVLDVALREPGGAHSGADGPALSAARDGRDAYWLRERRNGIVHYEGGRGGLMGVSEKGGGGMEELRLDAARALSVLADALDTLAGG